MSEVGAKIVKTEETEEYGIKFLNINVSNSEVERKPDIVRLCSDAGIIEYAKPKIGHWILIDEELSRYKCSKCGEVIRLYKKSEISKLEKDEILSDYPFSHCGCRMVNPQENEE